MVLTAEPPPSLNHQIVLSSLVAEQCYHSRRLVATSSLRRRRRFISTCFWWSLAVPVTDLRGYSLAGLQLADHPSLTVSGVSGVTTVGEPEATALDYFIRVGYKGVDVLGDRPPFSKWIPEFVLGVPNMGNPYKDNLWVLLWLQMEHYFCENTFAHPKNHIDNVGNKVRMDTALALVTEHVNELKVVAWGLASEDWERRRWGQSTNP
ncbi:hypothetical protein PIB30_012241 [Stylosanthes scabra]|uniref:Uncharacterized protein n=1 Tax=Stylosanthes scabra TaxID=79078 RepID=A0ABU6V562_9FABA|nr:hypothetical protein [Stylosanthes scabra]